MLANAVAEMRRGNFPFFWIMDGKADIGRGQIGFIYQIFLQAKQIIFKIKTKLKNRALIALTASGFVIGGE